MTLAYYITAHGYGHGARSCDILAALLRVRRDLVIHVVTDLPESFLRSRLPAGGWTLRRGAFDAGMVQLDSIRVDVSASLRAVQALVRDWPARVAEEAAWLARDGVRAVVADIPGIPIEAAKMVGLPALAVGNFAWDWIYEPFAEGDAAWQPVVETYRAAYASCDLLLRLPFHEPMEAFPRRVDLSVLARPGRARREEIAAHTGADPAARWVLLSFTSLEWDAAALDRVDAVRGCVFFAMEPLAWSRPRIRPVCRRTFSYADLLASCDVVVTKPGYGVLSECAVNGKPIVYAEREDFREYPVLEAALKRHFRSVHLPAAKLYRGELADALDAVAIAPPPRERLAFGGDDQAAQWILKQGC